MHIFVSYVNISGIRMYLVLVGVLKLISSVFFPFLVVYKITIGHILDSVETYYVFELKR